MPYPSLFVSLAPTNSAFIEANLAAPGLLIHHNSLTEPTVDVRKALMGFAIKDTVAPSLTEEQRYHLPGQCIDINLLSWLIRAASSQRPDSSVTPPVAPVNNPPRLTTRQFAPGAFIPADHYPLTQPPALLDSLPTITSPSSTSTTPFPPPISPWKPLWLPTEWVYTDGSKIDPNPKLGTSVITPPPPQRSLLTPRASMKPTPSYAQSS